MNTYISELVEFIHSQRIIKPPIFHRELELLPDGKVHVKMSFHSHMFETKNLPFPIKQSMMFMLLDAHIDNINPELSNGNFKNKYEALPDNDKNSKILKEIYRVFRFIRNNIIHDINSIVSEDEKIIIHGKKNSILKMNDQMIGTMNYIVYIIVLNNMSNAYNSLILQNIYEHFCSGIIEFKDDITDNASIKKIEADVKLKKFYRLIIIGAKSRPTINDSILEVELYNDITSYGSEDYLLKVGDDFYFIPNEILDKDGESNIGKISFSEANKFKLDIENPTIDILLWDLLKNNIV
jgi:hypothetical protein